MNARESLLLPDVQSSSDGRRLPIQRVGVKDLRYPIAVAGASGIVRTVGTLQLTVGLAPHAKGTHMSRFVELLEAQEEALTHSGLLLCLGQMLARLEADSGRIEVAFPYFIRKSAPVSGIGSLLDVEVTMIAEHLPGVQPQLTLRVAAPVTSLCPCSKQISAYGAHNQRSTITIEAVLRAPLDIEELVRLAEEQASCEVFGLLKRPDEKWVTERAYDNPKFVEDLVRDIALQLMDEPRIRSWKVTSENFESIHNHSAYAELWGSND